MWTVIYFTSYFVGMAVAVIVGFLITITTIEKCENEAAPFFLLFLFLTPYTIALTVWLHFCLNKMPL